MFAEVRAGLYLWGGDTELAGALCDAVALFAYVSDFETLFPRRRSKLAGGQIDAWPRGCIKACRTIGLFSAKSTHPGLGPGPCGLALMASQAISLAALTSACHALTELAQRRSCLRSLARRTRAPYLGFMDCRCGGK
ncbi:hypothetical protein PAPYR_6424 [Paratrimastix pyriformis]|uniref:Uncharacterized protein n=1 Tax=Paratrimastix pyriformis TaxID=342808 RepID=A0ABQ8UI91_9EUKA|nr:hypothetical protein PAPYR_6424 [Paratrimastix pyriformis]